MNFPSQDGVEPAREPSSFKPNSVPFASSSEVLVWLGLAVPVVAFLWMLARNAIDVPRGDDFISIIPFANRWVLAQSLAERLELVLAQYTSHRIVLTKIATALEISLLGSCNFLYLQVMGWISWLGVAGLAIGASGRVRASPVLGLPVLLILLQPQGSSNFMIAMQSVGNLGVLFLSFASLSLVLSPNRLSNAWALALAMLAPLASINGLLAFPTAVIALALKGDWRRCWVFAAFGGATWAAVLSGYSNPQSPFDIVDFLRNAAVMVGGVVRFGSLGFGFATAAGVTILLLCGWALLWSGLRRGPSVLVLFLLFVCLSVAMASRGRIGWGSTYMDQDRYHPYGLLALALLYLILLENSLRFRGRAFAASACFASMAFCLVSYSNYLPGVTMQRNWTDATAINHHLGVASFNVTPDLWGASLQEWQRAVASGLVVPPQRLSESDLAFIRGLDEGDSAVEAEFISAFSGSLAALGLTPAQGERELEPPDLAILFQDSGPMSLPVNVWRATLSGLPRRASFYSDRFELILPCPLAESGRHSIFGLRRVAAGELKVLWRGTVEIS